MIKRTPKRAAIVAGTVAVAVALAGCTAGGDDPADESTLSIFTPQDSETNLATNSFTAEMEELAGVDFDFELTTYDGTTAAEARQIAFASGNYPEAFFLVPWVDQFSREEVAKYGQQGVFVKLNDLIEEHAPNITAAFEEYPEIEAFASDPDGNIYGLPQWNDCYHCQHQAKYWINAEWLDALDLEMPTTTDELFDVLMAFKTEDPNGNGIADEIPLTSSVDDLLLPYFTNAFLYNPQGSNTFRSSLAVQDGVVTEQAVQDAYRDALAFVHELYAAGLVDEESFTQNRDAFKAKGDNADTVIVGSATTLLPAIFVSLDQPDGRDDAYQAVPPLVGPDGAQYASYNLPSMPGASFAITNKASEAEQIAAIKVVDSWYSEEGHLRAEFGVEDTSWRAPEAGEVGLDEALEPLFATIPQEEGEDPRNDNWGPRTQYNSNIDFRNRQVQPMDTSGSAGLERFVYNASTLYEPYVPQDQVFPYWNLWVPADLVAENADLKTNIENLVMQASAEFVTGTRDISDDADWQAYVDSLAGLGLDRYLEIQQDAYDALG